MCVQIQFKPKIVLKSNFENYCSETAEFHEFNSHAVSFISAQKGPLKNNLKTQIVL